MHRPYAVLLVLTMVVALSAGCASQSGTRSLAWDVATLKEDGWGGAPREAPVIEGDDLILRGKEIRTQRSYSAPITVEFDTMLEREVASDGALTCEFVPTTQAIDLDLERGILVPFSYDTQKRGWIYVYERFERQPTPRGKTWSRTELSIDPGSWHHLKYEVTKESLRLTVDGKAYSSGGAVVPYDRFYIYLSGWQPDDRWHVRGFTVH